MAEKKKKKEVSPTIESILGNYDNLKHTKLEDSLAEYVDFKEEKLSNLTDITTAAITGSYTLASTKLNELSKNDHSKTIKDIGEDKIKKTLAELAEEQLKKLHPEHYKILDILGLKGDERIDAILDIHSNVGAKDERGYSIIDFKGMFEQFKKSNGTIGQLLGSLGNNLDKKIENSVAYHHTKIRNKIFDQYHIHDFVKYIHKTAKSKGQGLNKPILAAQSRSILLDNALHMHQDSYSSKEHAKQYGIIIDSKKKAKIIDIASKQKDSPNYIDKKAA